MRAFLRRLNRPLPIDNDTFEWLVLFVLFLVLGLFAHLGWIGRGGGA